jgi:hypothetical protein
VFDGPEAEVFEKIWNANEQTACAMSLDLCANNDLRVLTAILSPAISSGIYEATGNSSGGDIGSTPATSGVAGNPVIDTKRAEEDEEKDKS